MLVESQSKDHDRLNTKGSEGHLKTHKDGQLNLKLVDSVLGQSQSKTMTDSTP